MKLRPILTLVAILGIACLVINQPGYAAPFALKSYRALYTVKYDGIPFGRSETTLDITPTHQYQLCVTNITTIPLIRGQVKECSTGLLLANSIKPSSYTYSYNQGGNNQNLQINFDWKKQQAIMTVGGSSWRMPIDPNTQDKISYQLAIRLGLAQQQTFFSFPIADGGKLKIYQFTVADRENISTPLQDFTTIKLERLPIPGKENVSLWLAPQLDYIVVRAQQTKHIVDIGTAEITHFKENEHVKI